jgi:hypothetical protein
MLVTGGLGKLAARVPGFSLVGIDKGFCFRKNTAAAFWPNWAKCVILRPLK